MSAEASPLEKLNKMAVLFMANFDANAYGVNAGRRGCLQ